MVKSPGVGVAALILHENRVLIGRRDKAPMPGSWQLPGGWVEYGVSPHSTLARKIRRFPGMRVGDSSLVAFTDNHFDDGLHTISLYFRLTCLNAGEVDLDANTSCKDWTWADWHDLPDDLFLPLALLKNSGFTI